MTRLHWFWRAAIAFRAALLVGVAWMGVMQFGLSGRTAPAAFRWVIQMMPSLSMVTAPMLIVSLTVYGLLTKHLGPGRMEPETRCRKCGYILRGIPEPRCSECGERIILASAKSAKELVMAPEPKDVARPATVGACQVRAQ